MTVCLPTHPLLGTILAAIPFLALLASGILFFTRLRVITGFFASLPRWQGLSLAGMALTLTCLAYGLSPRGPLVYYDEFQHAEATSNLVFRLDPHGCCAYHNGECLPGGPILWPLASHVAAAPFLAFAETSNPVLAGLAARTIANSLWLGLSPALLTLWLLLLFKRPHAAHAAGWLWAFNPVAAKLMLSASLMPAAAGMLLLALIALEGWKKSMKFHDFCLVVFLFTAVLHTRMEMFLALVWLPFALGKSVPRRMSAWLFLFLASAIPPLVFLYMNGAAGGAAGWNENTADSWTHLLDHLPGNLRFLAGGLHVPLLLPLALIGAALERNCKTLGLIFTSLGFLTFYSAYHIGRFDPVTSFDGWRYSVPVTLFLIPLAALGWERLWSLPNFQWRKIATGTLAVALVWVILDQQNFRRSEHPMHAWNDWVRERFETAEETGNVRYYTKETAYLRAYYDGDIFEWTLLDNPRADLSELPSEEQRYFRTWREETPDFWEKVRFEAFGPPAPDLDEAAEFRIVGSENPL